MHNNKNKFAKETRLRSRENFQQVYKKAKRFRYDGLTALVCKNELTYSRIGISIPKRQIRRAVDRNRIKRVIRENFRNRQKESSNIDVVFLIHASLLGLSNTEINACLEWLWSKVLKFCEVDSL